MNRSRVTGDLASQGNIFVDIANDRVGIGSTIPGQKLSLPDSAKIALGNSADLQIFHDGTHSRINAVNTGFLALSSGADALTLSAANRIDISDDFIRLRSRDGSDVYMTGTVNAAVDLYHNGTKKFETTAYGIDVTGTTGTDGLAVSGVSTFASAIDANGNLDVDGQTDLDVLNVSDTATFSGRVTIATHTHFNFGSNNDNYITQGSSGNTYFRTAATTFLQINNSGHLLPYADSTFDLGTSSKRFRNFYADTLYGDGSNLTGIDTDLVSDTSPQLGGNLDVNTKNILFGDSASASDDRLIFGAGSDLSIYHNGSHSYISDQGTGRLKLLTSYFNVSNAADDEHIIEGVSDGAVNLYYNGSKKFETTNAGVTLNGTAHLVNSGNFYPNSDGSLQLGLSNRKWSTINGVSLNINGGDAEFRGTTPGTTDMTWDQSENALNFDDNVYAHFGNGDDLKIYHNGTGSLIDNDTGNLLINTASGEVQINKATSEYMARFIADGQVELYFNNSKKLETVTGGVYVYGDLGFGIGSSGNLFGGDNRKLLLGSGNDLQLFHDGANSYIQHGGTGDLYIDTLNNSADMYIRSKDNLHLRTNSNAQESVVCVSNGGVILYNAGSQKFTTNGDGVSVTGNVVATGNMQVNDNNYMYLGNSGDLNLRFLNGTGAFIQSGGNSMYIRSNLIELGDNSGHKYIKCIDAGAVELYHGVDSKKFETTSVGVEITGSGQHALLLNGTMGSNEGFKYQNDTSGGLCQIGFQQQDSDGLHHRGYIRSYKGPTDGNFGGTIQFVSRGKTLVDGGLVLETGSGGRARFEYHVVPRVDNTHDLGTTSLRWRNLYVTDLQLSNKGKKNDVDGTWGDWTLQEGEEEIFMINNRTGKKYAMMLKEVN